jgi:hypothetical protein
MFPDRLLVIQAASCVTPLRAILFLSFSSSFASSGLIYLRRLVKRAGAGFHRYFIRFRRDLQEKAPLLVTGLERTIHQAHVAKRRCDGVTATRFAVTCVLIGLHLSRVVASLRHANRRADAVRR